MQIQIMHFGVFLEILIVQNDLKDVETSNLNMYFNNILTLNTRKLL